MKNMRQESIEAQKKLQALVEDDSDPLGVGMRQLLKAKLDRKRSEKDFTMNNF